MTRGVLPVRIIVCLLWLMAVGAGFGLLSDYQSTKGKAGKTPGQWPSETRIALDVRRDTLLMFVHPQCPCTRASLEELNRLIARSGGNVAAQVWFFRPAGFSEQWTRAGLWQSASAIPGVTAHEDPDGLQARQFGAQTSGYVLLYDTHGRLLFKGGITAGRGHAGDNAGEDALVSILAGKTAHVRETAVFGCSLLGDCSVTTNEVIK
jgi:hypothetical protein